MIHDLTHPVEDGMPVYPGDPPVEVTPHATHSGEGYRVTALTMGTHAGTHVDAPSHTEPDGRSLGEFPLDRFRWSALRVDCREVDPRGAITPGDCPVPGDFPDSSDVESVDLLAVWTGFDRHFGTDRYADHPFLSPDAARWCARHDLDVAIDAPSVDPSRSDGDDASDEYPAHHALLGSDRVVVENLRNLGSPSRRFDLHALPLAVDADGAPVRAVALAGNGND